MSPAIDPKELKTLSDILALVLEDQPGQSASALEAIRARARKNAVTGGALKNLFVAIAPNPPAQAAPAPRTTRTRTPKATTGSPAEMQAARTRISQLTADLNRLDLELREAMSRNESMRSELNLTRRARAEAQQAAIQAQAESRPRAMLLVLSLLCGVLVGIAGSAVVRDMMPARTTTDISPLSP
ncbi:hypothetical protein [Lichenicoccus roseus]|uniref:Uncharacterized protein n=1 Tax=Lichenicoccus roseus TaxID=2683649 RepID=A0A5R9J758_9PROT|nr:hypothetical protein [Lichenicoccus roseus]TLU73435.1 hypothetical protein FE263_08575 [Lichenicoccus roseus]